MQLLRRIPGERYSEVLPIWGGGTVAIICGGPSLTQEQVAEIALAREERRIQGVIAVNDAYLWAPFSDVCYFADSSWWGWHHEGIDKPLIGLTKAQVKARFASFAGQKCSIQNSGGSIRDPAVHLLKNLTYPNRSDGLSIYAGKIGAGSNGGFQAMNIATLSAAKKILFLALDGYGDHWHGNHPRTAPDTKFEAFRKTFSASEAQLKALGVSVFNCAPGSRIDSFPKCSIAEALQ